jgi:hypothetical protein
LRFSVTSSRRPATPPPIFPSRKCVAKTSLPGTDHRIVKDRTGPDLDERSVYISMSPNQAIVSDNSIRFSPLAAAQPLAIRSWPGALNARGSRRAGRMPIRRNAYSLLALPDFQEFAQAVRYGVPGTYKSGPGLRLSGLAGIDKPEAQAKAFSKSWNDLRLRFRLVIDSPAGHGFIKIVVWES